MKKILTTLFILTTTINAMDEDFPTPAGMVSLSSLKSTLSGQAEDLDTLKLKLSEVEEDYRKLGAAFVILEKRVECAEENHLRDLTTIQLLERQIAELKKGK